MSTDTLMEKISTSSHRKSIKTKTKEATMHSLETAFHQKFTERKQRQALISEQTSSSKILSIDTCVEKA